MTISATCRACGRKLRLSDDRAGKRVRCPDCREIVQVSDGRATTKKSSAGGVQSSSRRKRTSASSARRRRAQSASGNSQKIAIIVGAVLLVGVGGFAAWKTILSPSDSAESAVADTTGTESPAQTGSPTDTASTDPPPAVQRDVGVIRTSTTSQPVAEIASRDSSAGSGTAGSGTAGSGASGSGASGSGTAGGGTQRATTSRSSTNTTNTNVITGDRVAWVINSEAGFLKTSDGWVFYGGRGAKEKAVRFVETMRTEDFVELFRPGSRERVRITKSDATFYTPTGANSLKSVRVPGGSWANSTAAMTPNESVEEVIGPEYDFPQLDDDTSLKDLIATVERNVVRVNVSTADGAGNGSGFLLDPSGRIVTNYHVVEGCKKCNVVFKGEEGSKDIELSVDGFLYVDAEKDIAIIQAVMPANLKRSGLRLASGKPAKGTGVVAFGAPLGLDFTASEGIISGSRSSSELKSTLGIDQKAGTWIQTTAPISPGNSGGPLVDRQGNVVAINTMTLTVGQSLNFGISSDDIHDAAAKADLVPRRLTPTSVPVIIAKRGSGKAGSANPGEVVDVLPSGVQVVDIQDTELAAEMLADLEEIQYLSFPTPVNNGEAVLQKIVRDYAKDALESVDVKMVLDEGPVLLVIAVTRLSELELVAHLYAPDPNSRRVVRMWRGAGDMGELTEAMWRRKRFTGEVHKSMDALFDDLRASIAKAREPDQAPAPSESETEPAK